MSAPATSTGAAAPAVAPAAGARGVPLAVRRPWYLRVSTWFAALVLFAGLFAPLIANEVPLVARHDGRWSFPAFAELVGRAGPGPQDLSWKQWWSRLPATGDDFAWMPPWSYGPAETDLARARVAPSAAHPCGCDDTGRDQLALLIHGARTVVLLGLPAVLLGCVIGTLLGALAGLRGGVIDVLVSRLIELFLCFPTLLFLLFVSAFFGSSRTGLVIVMASLFWTSFARIVRGALLSLRERDFVHVARGLGVGELRVFTRHLLPQVLSQIGVTAAFCMAAAVVAESTLSFLGVGPGDASGSWGTMLRHGSDLAAVGAWHLWFFPALAIMSVVVCCHVLADHLRRDDAA